MLNANVYLATKTLENIDAAIRYDQGKLYRHYLKLVLPHIGDAYRQDEDPFRTHMGASGIGGKCAREIWYGFRWATKKAFSGQQLMLFNRGHLEEARFIAMLLAAGIQVFQQDANGNQFRISHAGGHFGGSGDGILVGVPDVPTLDDVLGEFKTLSTKYAPALEKNGCRAEKFEHYVQVNVYMRKMGKGATLYLSVDKNTDKLYGEIIPLNVELADEYLERGRLLVFMMEPPQKLSNQPGWYECKFCDHRPVCHLNVVPERTCRSCMFARPEEDGTWSCTNAMSPQAGTIDKQRQLIACDSYHRAF